MLERTQSTEDTIATLMQLDQSGRLPTSAAASPAGGAGGGSASAGGGSGGGSAARSRHSPSASPVSVLVLVRFHTIEICHPALRRNGFTPVGRGTAHCNGVAWITMSCQKGFRVGEDGCILLSEALL